MTFVFSRSSHQSVGQEVEGVGVMKDEEIKSEEIETSHILGGTGR